MTAPIQDTDHSPTDLYATLTLIAAWCPSRLASFHRPPRCPMSSLHPSPSSCAASHSRGPQRAAAKEVTYVGVSRISERGDEKRRAEETRARVRRKRRRRDMFGHHWASDRRCALSSAGLCSTELARVQGHHVTRKDTPCIPCTLTRNTHLKSLLANSTNKT